MADETTRFARANAEIASLAFTAPFVVAARMTQFWMHAAGPRGRDRREAERMVSEKMQAIGESVVAMNLATMNAAMSASLALFSGTRREVDDADAILHAGLLPYSRRVRANRKRLLG